MEWTFIVYTTLVLVSISPVSTEIPPSAPQEETKVPTEIKTTTNAITLADVTTTKVLNNVNNEIPPRETSSTSPVPPKTTTASAADSQPNSPDNAPTNKGIALATSPAPQTTVSSSSTTTTLSSSTTTTRIPSTSNRKHHGKKNLEEDTLTSSSVPAVVHYYSSPHPIDTINQQFVDVPEPKDIEDVTQTEAPTSKSSLFAGLIFGSLLSLALGFLIYKRLDSARRRREYRRMNDYLIDGMYNDI